jgi:hypothetical protein
MRAGSNRRGKLRVVGVLPPAPPLHHDMFERCDDIAAHADPASQLAAYTVAVSTTCCFPFCRLITTAVFNGCYRKYVVVQTKRST